MDCFVKLSVWKALIIPLGFLKGLFTYINLRTSVFGLIKLSFRVPKKGQLRFLDRN